MANRSRISELSPQRNDWSIRVKVLKKWSEMIDGGGDILRFLLVDEFGGKIPAKVSPEFGLYDRFNFDVHEDHWKIFTGFIVELASIDFRFAVNDHCIIFTENTEVHNSGGVHQDHYMNFKDYIDIKNGVHSSHYPIDLIGYLENVGELKVARDQNFTLANNKKTNKVTFLIKNLGGDILECKAYGVLAFQLYDKWWRHGDTETIITMSDWMVYMDPRTNEIKIKDAGGISRFEFNGPYQDVFDFSYEYGDADGRVPVIGSRYCVEALGLSVKSEWRSWFHNHQVGGRITEYEGGLTFVTVRGAGHLVPLNKPEEALALFRSYLTGQELPSRP